jgi:hypothetical protein
MGVLPTFRESSPSSKLLQAHQFAIWWTDACPWHGLETTRRLHSSTILGACLLQPHSAIYSRSQTSGRWLSDDIVTTWSRGPADMCTIKGDDFVPVSRRPLSLVHQWCLSPPQSHMAIVPPRFVGSLSFPGWQENIWPLLTRDPAVYGTQQNLTICQRDQHLTKPLTTTTPRPSSTTW